MQALIRSLGGTIETYFLDRQPTTVTVNVYTGDGALKVSGGSGTIDSVSTTLSSATDAEDDTLSVASGTGIVVGRRYLVGTSSSTEAAEMVTVKQISGAAVTLFAPMMYEHASGAAFVGTRVSLSVTSTQADALWWDGYADFIPTSGDTITETVDCVLRKIPVALIDETDIRDVFPKAPKMLDVELDMALALRGARDAFLRDLGGKFRAMCMLGTEHLRRACALKFWLMRRHSFGSDWAETINELAKDYDNELDKLRSQVPVDNDQDGMTTSPNDGGFTTGRIMRA